MFIPSPNPNESSYLPVYAKNLQWVVTVIMSDICIVVPIKKQTFWQETPWEKTGLHTLASETFVKRGVLTLDLKYCIVQIRWCGSLDALQPSEIFDFQ